MLASASTGAPWIVPASGAPPDDDEDEDVVGSSAPNLPHAVTTRTTSDHPTLRSIFARIDGPCPESTRGPAAIAHLQVAEAPRAHFPSTHLAGGSQEPGAVPPQAAPSARYAVHVPLLVDRMQVLAEHWVSSKVLAS